MSELLAFEWAVGAERVSIQEAGLRLVLAIVLSGLVGIDRELKHKPLGLRTNMLVALGAASFSLMSMHLVHVLGSGPTEIQIDPGRVMEAIVGAIGFLGAAAIIQGRFELFGATTGASIWVVGAIGMACGFGFYALAALVTAAGMFVLTVLGMITGTGAAIPTIGRRPTGTSRKATDPESGERDDEAQAPGPWRAACGSAWRSRPRRMRRSPMRRTRRPARQARPERPRRWRRRALPEPSTTRHEIEIGGRRIGYPATAGTLPLGRDPERPDAHLFYVAYVADQADAGARPVAFVLNGGPGASAAYLHLGALGPRGSRVEDAARRRRRPSGSCRTRIPGSRSPTSCSSIRSRPASAGP